MKELHDLINITADSYQSFVKSKRWWDQSRSALEHALQLYVQQKSEEFFQKYELNDFYRKDLFLVSLGAGSATENWKPYGGWFYQLMFHKEGRETTWYESTTNKTWHIFDYAYRIL
jgi:hypothetical protein